MSGPYTFKEEPLPVDNAGNTAPLLWVEGTEYVEVSPRLPLYAAGEPDVNGVLDVYVNEDRKYGLWKWFETLEMLYRCLHNNTYNIPTFEDRRHGTYGFPTESAEGQMRVRALLAEVQNAAGFAFQQDVNHNDRAIEGANLAVILEFAKRVGSFVVPKRMFAPENQSEPVIVQLRFVDGYDPLNVVLNQFSQMAAVLANEYTNYEP